MTTLPVGQEGLIRREILEGRGNSPMGLLMKIVVVFLPVLEENIMELKTLISHIEDTVFVDE